MIQVNLKLISDSKKIVFIQSSNVEEIHSFILNNYKLTRDNYYLRSRGYEVLDSKDISGTVEVIPRLCGGKGGFGSMLRAIGAQIEKTTNREACRDLSGRRLRDINEEQRLKKWISQQAEREREIEEKRKKKLEKLTSEPNHEFKDEKYFEERSEMTEKLNDAFEKGLMASSSSSKRKNEEEKKPLKKKKKLIVDFDEFSSSNDSGENNDSDEDEVADEVQYSIKSSSINEGSPITNERKDKLIPASSKDINEDETENETSQNTSKNLEDNGEVHSENIDNSEVSNKIQDEDEAPQKFYSTNTEDSKSPEKIDTQNSE